MIAIRDWLARERSAPEQPAVVLRQQAAGQAQVVLPGRPQVWMPAELPEPQAGREPPPEVGLWRRGRLQVLVLKQEACR